MGNMTSPTFRERVGGITEPGLLLCSGAYYFTTTLFGTVFRGELLAPVLRLSQIRDEAFSRFWIKFSGAREPEPSNPQPLQGSSALIPPLLAQADGVVLDIGPGTGSQTPLFTNPNLKKMYGAEPCTGLHADLRAKIISCGLGEKYQIVSSGAQPKALVPALQKEGLLPETIGDDTKSMGIFDTVVCVRVLCSVPQPAATIKTLYSLLKPGGKMIVCEHVVNPWQTRKGSVLARIMQTIYQLMGWSFFIGDCHLNRDTGGMLRSVADEDGGWESVDLESSFGWSCLSYVSGVLVKKQ